jgi:YidC/Oxa1 family membrane protein insertase
MEQRRWLIFFLTSFLIIQIWMMLFAPPPRPRPSTDGSTQTTETLTSVGMTTATPGAIEGLIPLQGITTTTPAIGEGIGADPTRPPRLERGQKTISFLTEKYFLTFDLSGGVLRSMRLIDPGSDSLRETSKGTTEGIELIRTIPGVSDPGLPLELSYYEDGAYDFEQLNRMEWKVRFASGSAEKPGDVRLELESPIVRGIRTIKTLEFGKTEWFGKVRVTLLNETTSSIRISDDRQRGLTLRWGPGLLERKPGEVTSADAHYDTIAANFTDGIRVLRPVIDKDPIEHSGLLRWAGVESKFFAALLVPTPRSENGTPEPFSIRTTVPSDFRLPLGTPGDWNPPAVLELSSGRFELAGNGATSLEFGLYAGPKKYRVLKGYGFEMERAMFAESWWWMRIIYLGLTDILNVLYRFAGNYGVAIIFLTILVRLVVFPLTHKGIKIQAKSMAEMSRVKPYIDEINEKYKDDPQEKSRRIWQVYQEHNINPLAGLRGCFPMLLQMPIFIGLYRVANDTIDLQGASFLWIHDLSRPDHFLYWVIPIPFLGSYLNLLPLAMAVTQFIASKVSMARMTTIDPTQKQIMYMMPFILGFTLYTMPSGLMVYWTTSNIWQIFQTMITNKILDKEEERHKKEAASGKVQPSGSATSTSRGQVTVLPKKKNPSGNKGGKR